MHIGQSHSRAEQVGLSQHIREASSGGFSKFTEMSAAAAEKKTLHDIPFSHLVADILRTSLPDSIKKRFINDYYPRLRIPYEEYVSLRHRKDGPVSESEVKAFLKKDEAYQFSPK